MNARDWSLRIADLARREHSALADFLVALAEFDRLGVHRQLGFPNLFEYLLREVGLSRGSAFYRQVGARLVGRFPEVVEPLRDGRLCISNLPQLAKVMTEENRTTVVQKFFHCSKQEAKQVVAEMLPAEVVPRRTVVTEFPMMAPVCVQPVERDPTHLEGARAAQEVRRTVVEPLTQHESRIHITVSPEFVALLKKAKAGQSHVQPRATDEQVLTAALQLLVAQQKKRKATVPAKVKREVMARDEGKCTWPLADGGTCGATVRLQIDHVVPRGKGGPSTPGNCRVLCQAHNLEAARQVYGDAHMDLFAVRAPAVREACAAYFVAGAATAPPCPRRGSRPCAPGSARAAPEAATRRGRWSRRPPAPPRRRCSAPPPR